MADTQRDPVCGMEVEEQSAAGRSNYQGQSYYFCSENCKRQFDQNPQQYARERGRGTGSSA
ncbi:MAG TPA: YHS domain-containing protein [Pyrinomonadaceae bacterium]|nr:YHS domain-containing protein [Pyrinomonadaceae bacterium]